MGGKVFAESSNIYQDEAKILFDYYRKAAESIVAEEKRIEGEIAQKDKNIADLKERGEKIKKNKTLMLVLAIAGGIIGLVMLIAQFAAGSNLLYGIPGFLLGIVGVILFLARMSELKKNEKMIPVQQKQIDDLIREKKNIRRDYRVSKLGVAYVPVASRVPFEGKSFMVDYTGNVENTKFSISVLHKPDEFKESLSALEQKLNSVPVVETNENAEQIDSSDYSVSMQNVTMHDYVGTIDREVRNISYLLSDSDTLSVSLPVIEPSSPEDEFIKEYATQDVEGKPVVNVFDVSDFDQKLKAFSEINEVKKSINSQTANGGNVNYFKNLIRQLGVSVQLLTDVKTNSISKLLDYSGMILNGVLKAGYNHYSPVLEADEIERIRTSTFNYQDGGEDYQPFNLKQSSRVRFELFSQSWFAEDGSRTNYPFGMHQIQEEVLMPVLTNLLNETRIERLKIYNNIKDQKMNYLNKWNQDIELAFRDNRARGQELVTEITNAYAEYNTAYHTYLSYKNTLEKMSEGKSEGRVEEMENSEEQIAGFQIQAQQCNQARDDFQAFMDRLTEDIDRKGEEFNRIELYEASLRDSLSRDFAQAQTSETMQNLDERRRRLVRVNPYYAANAELPPEPSTEPSLLEDFVIGVSKEAAEALRIIEEKEQGAVDFEEDVIPDFESEEESSEPQEEPVVPQDPEEEPEVPQDEEEELPEIEDEELEEEEPEEEAEPEVPQDEEEELPEIEDEEFDEEEPEDDPEEIPEWDDDSDEKND
ncbi:MAG: hypothetical protein IKP61_04610 [Spirochaetales bacterium]|nr:hypothetical protein [Spirochaetales bacterium]